MKLFTTTDINVVEKRQENFFVSFTSDILQIRSKRFLNNIGLIRAK